MQTTRHDLAAFARSWQELVDTTKRIRAKLREYGLEVNDDKTKHLISKAARDYPESIGKIKRANAFEYLGTTIDEEGDDGQDITKKITKAQRKCGELSNVFCSNKVSARLKVKALRAFILPVLSWGSGAWTVSKVQA